jgi:hypothetical protein
MTSRRNGAEEFERAASERQRGVIAEFWDFLRHNKKWWLVPILVLFLLMSALIVLGSTGLAPFIYPLF